MKSNIHFLIALLSISVVLSGTAEANNHQLECINLFKSSKLESAIGHCQVEADKGDIQAAEILTQIYSTKGKLLDKAKAFKWAKFASEKGSVSSQAMLGLMYLRGDGTKKDIEKAQYYIQLAIDNGNQGAKQLRNLMKQAGLWRKSPK